METLVTRSRLDRLTASLSDLEPGCCYSESGSYAEISDRNKLSPDGTPGDFVRRAGKSPAIGAA